MCLLLTVDCLSTRDARRKLRLQEKKTTQHYMMEWSTALRQCSAANSQQRSEAIDQLTELLQQNDWQLPSGEGGNVFIALRERLNDSNWYAPVEPLLRGASCVCLQTCDERIGCSLCAHRAGRSVKSACCSLVISWPSPM